MEPESWAVPAARPLDRGRGQGSEQPSQVRAAGSHPRRDRVRRGRARRSPLKVVAHWADGTTEDVTCLSRFRTNDESVAEVDLDGVVTSKGKGDTHVVAFYDNGVAVTQVLAPVSDKVGIEVSRRADPDEDRRPGRRQAQEARDRAERGLHRRRVPPPGRAST